MILTLDSHGEVPINQEEEMIPSDFYDDKDPDNETFEPTGNGGIHAERQYSDENAIVVWPKSRGWEILTGGDTLKMIEYFQNEACNRSIWRTEKLQVLSDKIIRESRNSSDTYIQNYMHILKYDNSRSFQYKFIVFQIDWFLV